MALENLSVWTIPPDWAADVTETLDFLTSILQSPIGAEQRFSVRRTPRRSFEMTFSPVGPFRTLFDLFVERAGGSSFYLPLWHEAERLTVAATIGIGSITVRSTTETEFAECPGLILYSDPFNYEIAEISSIAGAVITLNGTLASAWPIGTRVYPIVKSTMPASVQMSRKANRAFTGRIRFTTDQSNDHVSNLDPALDLYNDQLVLGRVPNDVNDLSFEYERLMAELDNNSGFRTRLDLNDWGSTVQQYAFFLKGRADHQWARDFFYRLQGRKYPLFVPTFFMDLEPTEPLDGATVTVKRCGYTDFDGPFRGRQFIDIVLRDGTHLYRKILGSAIIGSAETLTLDNGFLAPIPLSDIERVSFMAVCRLGSDSIEIVHHTDSHGLATCTTTFRSIPQTRNPIPDPIIPSDSETGSSASDFVYFEVTMQQLKDFNIFGDGRGMPVVGFADAGFNLVNPHNLSISSGGVGVPSLANSLFWAFRKNTAAIAWGYPGAPPSGSAGGMVDVVAEGDVIGFALKRSTRELWMQNATQAPGVWHGGGVGTHDPVTVVGGIQFGAGTDWDGVGSLYLLAGVAKADLTANTARFTFNFSGPFVAAPTGYDPTTFIAPLNANDMAVSGTSVDYLLLTNGDLTVEEAAAAQADFGSLDTLFVRSMGIIS